MNMDVQKAMKVKTVTAQTRDQYFQNHASSYPALHASQTVANQTEPERASISEPPVKQPAVRIPQHETTPRTETKTPSYDFDRINRAQEYHRNTWEQSQPAQTPRPQQTPRQQPQQSPRPLPQQPQRSMPPSQRQQQPNNSSPRRK